MWRAEGPGRSFASLQALQLGSNRIAAWEQVCRLDALPALRELRLSGNPCIAGLDVVTARLEVLLHAMCAVRGCAEHACA